MVGLSISTEGSLDPAARLEVGPEGLTSPRSITRDLWRPDKHDLADILYRALHQLVGDEPAISRQATLVEEYAVTALKESYHGPNDEYHYARLASHALESEPEHLRFLQVTRQLGGSTSIGVSSSLEDIQTGPLQILSGADISTPTIVVQCTRFRDLKINQRSAILSHLLDLSSVVNIRLVATPLDQRCLLGAHRDELPASVTAAAESCHGGQGAALTRTVHRRETARDLIADRGEGHPDWCRLKVLHDAPQESMSYDMLEAHTLANFPSRDALKQWVRRMSEHDLLESYGSIHDRQVRLLPTGYALLDEHPDIAVSLSQGGSGRIDEHSKQMATEPDAMTATVSDPPNSNDSTVYPPDAHERGGDRPASETATATAGDSDAHSKIGLNVNFLKGFEHDAAVSMAKTGEIALCDRPIISSGDSREVSWSFLEAKDEAVVRVESSSWVALTMTRLCAALLSDPAFQQVLTENRLAGGPDKSGLDGLPVSNPYVLRSGACFGYLKNADANATDFRRRLRQERNELLKMTEDIEFAADPDLEAIGDLARKAHGLAGVATRLYDMLDIDVTRIIEVPKSVVADDDRRQHFIKMLATQTTVSSRYGVYSAHRVLYEERPDKRRQLLGAPDIDDTDPSGDIVGGWVLIGEDVDSLQEPLENFKNHLILQTDEENFAPFTLHLDVVDGNRRSAYATALTRQTRLKSIDTTRQTVSILRAVSSDVIAAAKAVSQLGSEADQPRDLEPYDVRSALSFLDPNELVPDIGPRTVSAVVHLLLDVDEPLSTSTVAEAVGVTSQTLSNNEDFFADLEAAGLLNREDLGIGKATHWRITLPFKAERRHSSAPNPTCSVGTTGSQIDFDRPVDALAEFCFAANHRDIDYGSNWFLEATSLGGNLDVLLQQCPSLEPVLRFVIELLVVNIDSIPLGGVAKVVGKKRSNSSQNITLGVNPISETTQISLAKVD